MALATNIHVVFDSRYGHIDTMAEAVAAGSDQAGNIEVTPVRVAELVPHEVLEESGAKAARAALPRPVAKSEPLAAAEAIISRLSWPSRPASMMTRTATIWETSFEARSSSSATCRHSLKRRW